MAYFFLIGYTTPSAALLELVKQDISVTCSFMTKSVPGTGMVEAWNEPFRFRVVTTMSAHGP